MTLLKYTSEEVQFSSVQLLSSVRLFGIPWIAACQASLSITNSQSSLTLTSIESVMPSSYLILCRPLLLLPPIRPSIRVFSNESTPCMRWPKYWSFSFSIIPSKGILGLISFGNINIFLWSSEWRSVSACLVVSNSLWPHRLQPAKLLCPWNFPSKNTWVGCHFLLQGIIPN